MTYLEKVRALISLDKLEKETHLKNISETILTLNKQWEIDLTDPQSTTPKKLFGKTYRELTKGEVAEYSQIKRIIRRYANG